MSSRAPFLVLLSLLPALALPTAGIGEAYLAAAVDGDCGTGADAPDEPAAALLLTLPAECLGAVVSLDTEDWYAFPAAAGQLVSVRVQADRGSTNFQARLVVPPGSTSTGTTHYPAPVWEMGFSWSFLTPSTGTHLLGVVGRGYLESDPGRAVGYHLQVSVQDVEPPAHDDCGSGRDATPLDPLALTFPLTCAGSFPGGSVDGEDPYTFTGTAGQRVAVTLRPQAGYYSRVCLVSPSGWRECDHATLQPPRPQVTVEGILPESGTWSIVVTEAFRGASTTVGYTLSGVAEAAGVKAPEDDCGLGRDAGDEMDAADPLPGVCHGTMTEFLDAVDWYGLEAEWGDVLRLRLRFQEGWGRFVMVSPSGEWLTPSWGQGACLVVDEPGTWRVAVSRFSFWAAYRLEAQWVRAGAPTEGPPLPLTGWPNTCDYNGYTRGIVQPYELA